MSGIEIAGLVVGVVIPVCGLVLKVAQVARDGSWDLVKRGKSHPSQLAKGRERTWKSFGPMHCPAGSSCPVRKHSQAGKIMAVSRDPALTQRAQVMAVLQDPGFAQAMRVVHPDSGRMIQSKLDEIEHLLGDLSRTVPPARNSYLPGRETSGLSGVLHTNRRRRLLQRIRSPYARDTLDGILQDIDTRILAISDEVLKVYRFPEADMPTSESSGP